MVRIGIGLYGCPIRPDSRASLGVEPIMTLDAVVINVKNAPAGTSISYNGRWTADHSTTIDTVGIGYADGYLRSLGGRGMVGINGRLCPVVGTICMDMIMVDIGPGVVDATPGDRAILFGRGGPDVSEVAEWADTIAYEITSGLGPRVEHQYF